MRSYSVEPIGLLSGGGAVALHIMLYKEWGKTAILMVLICMQSLKWKKIHSEPSLSICRSKRPKIFTVAC